MLGTTGGRFQGPSGSQVHHRTLWPPPLHPTRSLDFQQNGEGKHTILLFYSTIQLIHHTIIYEIHNTSTTLKKKTNIFHSKLLTSKFVLSSIPIKNYARVLHKKQLAELIRSIRRIDLFKITSFTT